MLFLTKGERSCYHGSKESTIDLRPPSPWIMGRWSAEHDQPHWD